MVRPSRLAHINPTITSCRQGWPHRSMGPDVFTCTHACKYAMGTTGLHVLANDAHIHACCTQARSCMHWKSFSMVREKKLHLQQLA